MTFEPFPKMARLFRECVVTEKIDGSNAQILVVDTTLLHDFEVPDESLNLSVDHRFMVFAGSRTRYILPGKTTDNYGFAGWVRENAEGLAKLGEGRHFGEWWGSGINRGYGLPKGEKRFSLFNVARWNDAAVRPACCDVVPVLYEGPFSTREVDVTKSILQVTGSKAAPGFMNPEGVVVWHEAARTLFKSTIEKDDAPKGMAA